MQKVLRAIITTIDEKNHVRTLSKDDVEIKILGPKQKLEIKPEPIKESKTEKIVEKLTKKKSKNK